MDVGKAIHVLLENQACFVARVEGKFARSEERFINVERRLDRIMRIIIQVERVIGPLTSTRLRFRNEIRRAHLETDRRPWILAAKQNETDDTLKAFIEIVDKSIRRNNGRKHR